ncbi:MAG: GNAT family N-acetyltransferase [Kiritimatiellae bacterium]|nr:GNAT family N-acetyltransferase [Kiritimatiellia bacterium]
MESNRRQITFNRLAPGDRDGILAMSRLATDILREHYDPILGKAQNNYMLEKFQSVDAINHQLESGYQYYFVRAAGRDIGFLAFYPRGEAMYLSKLYLLKDERGKGYSRLIVEFVVGKAREASLGSVELNVNKHNDAIPAYESLGFRRVRAEKNDIGSGYFMDDYVYALNVDDWQSPKPRRAVPHPYERQGDSLWS